MLISSDLHTCASSCGKWSPFSITDLGRKSRPRAYESSPPIHSRYTVEDSAVLSLLSYITRRCLEERRESHLVLKKVPSVWESFTLKIQLFRPSPWRRAFIIAYISAWDFARHDQYQYLLSVSEHHRYYRTRYRILSDTVIIFIVNAQSDRNRNIFYMKSAREWSWLRRKSLKELTNQRGKTRRCRRAPRNNVITIPSSISAIRMSERVDSRLGLTNGRFRFTNYR